MAEIDRGTWESRGRKEPKLLKVVMVTSIVAVLFASSLSLLSNPSSEIPPTPIPAGVSYTTHASIYIVGDAAFTAPNGVTGGNGTVSNPYIISGWEIDASSSPTGAGIYIASTTAYFIVRGCFVRDGGSSNNGINLANCPNCTTISDNICSNNCWGINLYKSNGITISNNTCSGNSGGISIGSSSNNTLIDNNCNSNNGFGIALAFTTALSTNNTLNNNTCSNNNYGIGLYKSSDNTLSNNNCSNNLFIGIYLFGGASYSSDNNKIFGNQVCNNTGYGVCIDSGSGTNNRFWDNTFIGNNGAGSVRNPSYLQAYDAGTNNRWNTSGTPHGYGNYWGDLTTPDANFDGIVDYSYNLTGSAGAKDFYPLTWLYTPHAPIFINGNSQFTLANGVVSGSGTIADPYILERWYIDASAENGIRIWNTDAHFILRDCDIHNGGSSYNGTYLNNSANGTLINNTCSNNNYGIVLWSSSNNNTLTNNTCLNNNRGISLDSSSNNTISNNTCSNNWAGIALDSSSNNTISNNNCSNNKNGTYLHDSSDNTLSNNTCSNNDRGISLGGSSDSNTLSDNTCSNNSYGITLTSSSDNTLSNNTCSDNAWEGIYLDSSSSNTLNNNNCSGNAWEGISLRASGSNTLSNNTCSGNWYGVYLDLSSDNTLSNNTCSSNNERGISLSGSSSNTLSNNTCSDNSRGIYLKSSSNSNTLSNNTCSNNQFGIYLSSSSDNTAAWNQICNNSGFGMLVTAGADRNMIWNNTFVGNNGAGTVYDPTHIQASDDGTNNWWNTSGSPHGYGNYWSDLTTPDVNGDGIVDDPFDYVIGGSAGAKDYYPLTTPSIPPYIPEFSDLVVPIVGLMLILLIVGRARKKPGEGFGSESNPC
jgi:parallel beta-helix repeat protein